jgi:hypothetical protein
MNSAALTVSITDLVANEERIRLVRLFEASKMQCRRIGLNHPAVQKKKKETQLVRLKPYIRLLLSEIQSGRRVARVVRMRVRPQLLKEIVTIPVRQARANPDKRIESDQRSRGKIEVIPSPEMSFPASI